jgi:hypothetical protein
VQTDTSLYREAADIYLDSAPFSSNTSALESAALGTAAIAYTPGRRPDSVTFCDLPGLDEKLLRGTEPSDYGQKLGRLISCPDYRAAVGEEVRSRVLEIYDPESWSVQLAGIYQSVKELDGQPPELGVSASRNVTHVDRAVVEISLRSHGPFAVASYLVLDTTPRWRRFLARQITRLDYRVFSRLGLATRVPPRWWPVLDRTLVTEGSSTVGVHGRLHLK